MTALSQAEDKARAEKLGADRYLVKSQVTLEDVAKVAKQVLEGEPAASSELPAPQAAAPSAIPPQPTPMPAADPTPAQAPMASAGPTPAPLPDPVVAQAPQAADPGIAPPQDPSPVDPPPEPQQPIPMPLPDTGPTPDPNPPVGQAPAAAQDDNAADDSDDDNAEHKKKVIQPINDLHEDPQAKLNMLLEKEKEREQMAQTVHDMVQTTQHSVSTEPGVDAATTEMPVAPPPADATKPDPNAIAL